jgi:hypothetical protein
VKRRVAIAAGALLALVAAYLGGRFSRAARVEERVKVETRTVTEWKDRIVYVEAKTEQRHTTTTATRKPDGTRTVVKVQDVRTDSGARLNAGSDGKSETAASSDASRVITAQPSWRLEGQAGWSRLSPAPDIYGIGISRRVAGTLWVGGWARTDKTAGLGVALEW